MRGGVDLDAPLPDLDVTEVTEVVRSPGVSPYRAALAALVAAGVPTSTPTGRWLAADRRPALVAVTGTKGKSTTAAMTAHVLRAVGVDVALCGNIGRTPLTGVDGPDQTVVIELSSYQLADLRRGGPDRRAHDAAARPRAVARLPRALPRRQAAAARPR